MNLSTLLKLASTRLDAGRGGASTSNLAFAEVDAEGRLVTVNTLARMKWGWQKGDQVRDEMRIALEGLAGKRPTELPLKIGGLHIGAIVRDKQGGWLVFGYDPDESKRFSDTKMRSTATLTALAGGELDNDGVRDADAEPGRENTPKNEPADGSVTQTFGETRGVRSGERSRDERRDDSGARRLSGNVQSALGTLRLLATTTADQAMFCDAALQTIAQSIGASSALLFASDGSGDLILASTSDTDADVKRSGVVLTDDHPVFQLVQTRGCATVVNRAIAPVICKQVGVEEAIVASVRDHGHLLGYIIIATNGAPAGPDLSGGSQALLGSVDQLVSTFSSLYSWIALIARYRSMISSVDGVVFSFRLGPGEQRKYDYFSDRIEQYSGYHAKELAGPGASTSWMGSIVHAEDRKPLKARTRDLLIDGEGMFEYRIVHRNGSIRWVQEHARVQRDGLGVSTITGTVRDVSEIRAVEAMVEDARGEAEAARRSKTAFIATLSHEVRTPLGALSGYAQLLEKELAEYEESTGHTLPTQIHEFVDVLTNRSNKLQSVVHDLFELSSLEMGGAIVRREPVPLHRVIKRAAARVEASLESKDVALELSLSPIEPVVFSNEQSLLQILDNVLSNAAKFTEQGKVIIRSELTKTEAIIEVEDTGVGIAEDYQVELFNPFSQEENWRNRKFGGTGMGLALSRRLLDVLGGRIEAESRKGVGSTFRIHLPVARQETA